MSIHYKEITKDGIELIGHIDKIIDEKQMKQIMHDICEEKEVCIYWQLRTNGEFFIRVDMCPAKICSGNIIND